MEKLAKTKTPRVKKGCQQKKCKKAPVNQGFCRLHYLANWKKIRLNEQIKAERRLNAYVDHLSKKYPKDYLEVIKENLEDADKFQKIIEEIDSDSSETDREYLENLARKVAK
jgi:hypothetical protein